MSLSPRRLNLDDAEPESEEEDDYGSPSDNEEVESEEMAIAIADIVRCAKISTWFSIVE